MKIYFYNLDCAGLLYIILYNDITYSVFGVGIVGFISVFIDYSVLFP